MTIPNIRVRGVRQSVPSGYILGRISPGDGPAELIPLSTAQQHLAASVPATAAGEWTAGAVNALDALTINNGTLTAEWQSGTVDVLGPNLTLAAGTLNAVTQPQEWNAGNVTLVGTGLTLVGEVLSLVGGEAGTGLFSGILSGVPTQSGTGLTTWENQGSASVSNNAVGMTITNPSTGSGLAVLRTSTPTPPVSYTALLGFTANPGNGSTNPSLLLGFSDGTKLQGFGILNTGTSADAYIAVQDFNSPTSFSSNPQLWLEYANAPVWAKIRNDGTNLTYSYSTDGVNFALMYSNSITNFLANANYVCFAVQPPPSGNAFGTIMSWTQGT